MVKKLLAIVLILVLPPLTFYGWFETSARSIVRERSLDPQFGNSIKHALASSYLYSGLRFIGVPGSVSEAAVIRAGLLNEFAELYVKRGKPDTTAEIMKDLHNNMVGVSLAKWLEESGTAARDDMLVALGDRGLLVLSDNDLDVTETLAVDGSADYAFAADWFAARRAEIDRGVGMALVGLSATPPIRAR
ncbi:MAG: hypothetical protein KF914_06880 [Rhizobiaceae bacterium]|nr:hypothetical protein [Rhizobiaceae bacterium]